MWLSTVRVVGKDLEAPHLIQQLLAADHDAWLRRQRPENLELPPRHFERRSFRRPGPPRFISAKVNRHSSTVS